jgi:predicted nucleic acid-binding protein
VDVAIDSSVLVGLLYPNDLWHVQAVALWTAIKKAAYTSIYFDCVATEAVSVASRRLHEKGRMSELDMLFNQLNVYASPDTITWISPDVPRLYPDALNLIRFSLGSLNFNDALIALACQERGIPAIASFDSDFDKVTWLRRLARPEDVITP